MNKEEVRIKLAMASLIESISSKVDSDFTANKANDFMKSDNATRTKKNRSIVILNVFVRGEFCCDALFSGFTRKLFLGKQMHRFS